PPSPPPRYSDAHASLQSSLRKSPDGAPTTHFRAACIKLSVIVQLLMGDIPPRDAFNDPHAAPLLAPYLALTAAVRSGNVQTFSSVLAANTSTFEADGNLSLISRLQHTVVKAGLRRLSLSYSRIGLPQVAARLGVEEAGVAYVVAKAIADGVIDGTIDHQEQ
ncbi:hypothetical protein TeGR_g112, partial [Tetraparma gracilis]